MIIISHEKFQEKLLGMFYNMLNSIDYHDQLFLWLVGNPNRRFATTDGSGRGFCVSVEIAHQLKNAGATGVVTTSELFPKVFEAQRLMAGPGVTPLYAISVSGSGPRPEGAWDFDEMLDPTVDTSVLKNSRSNGDVAFMPYSSGTTGLSKGVSLSHRNILANIAQTDHPEINHIIDTTGI